MLHLPPGMLGAVFLLWGWEHHLWWQALLLGTVLEGGMALDWRWRSEPRFYARAADFCTLLIFFFTLRILLVDGIWNLLLPFLKWLPLLMLPLALAMILGDARQLPLSVFFYMLRKRPEASLPVVGTSQMLTVYAVLVLLSAGAMPPRDPVYLPAAILLTGWWLWYGRSRRYSVWLWLLMLLLGGGGGFLIKDGLSRLQGWVQDSTTEWLAQWFLGDGDPWHRDTAIGDIRALKDSSRILFRVNWRGVPSILLREASYSSWLGEGWYASGVTWRPMIRDATTGGWEWPPTRSGQKTLTVQREVTSPHHLLALPMGVVRVDGLLAVEVQVTGLGSAKADMAPGLAEYTVRFDPTQPGDQEPGEVDRQVSPREAAALDAVIAEIGPLGEDPLVRLAAVKGFFQEHFRYSLTLERQDRSLTPMGDFLLRTRSGHCEYFATATALLLRRLGIPSRYAVGYLVQEELNGTPGHFVVRQRHAHAWTLAYVGGYWQEVDATPMGWGIMEAEAQPAWQILWDWGSELRLRWLEWQKNATEAERERLVWLTMGGMVGWLGWRYRGRIRLRWAGRRRGRVASKGLGEASLFTPILRVLEQRHAPRPPGEPVGVWIRRLGEDSLELLVGQYYGLCHDPEGDSASRRRRLVDAMARWLAQEREHGRVEKQ